MPRRSLTVLAIASAGLSLGACGGDDPMTADEFRAEAKKICLNAQREMAKVSGVTANDRAYARQLERIVEVNGRTRSRLGDLDPPDDLADAHRDLLESNDDAAELIGKIADRLERGETRKKVFVQDLGVQIREIADRTAGAAERLGVKQCAGGQS